ncbi:MAG TPA: class I SAM-dependent methyltransferase [Steroidobacteraceae bacterium]|nr:class I SAM-dependent methyltransferase [Steroidobacteraceae bacterium]
MGALLELTASEAYELWAANYPPMAHNALMRAEERAMLNWLPPSLHGSRVVDIGCGSGRYLLHARQRGATLLGVDQSAAMLRAAAGNGLPVVRGDVLRLPICSSWADLALCALTLGHVTTLETALREIARVLHGPGTALCSEPHPAGTALGWQRSFRVGTQDYAVQHITHTYADWHRACSATGLAIEDVAEPRLDPADIPPGAHFDRRALEIPVALVLKLRRRDS